MWTLFRVENEHCANVAHFKASRDVPLPYALSNDSQEDFQQESSEGRPDAVEPTAISPEIGRHRAATGATLEAQDSRSTFRRRLPRTLTSIVAEAHTQDFEKKRKPATAEGESLLGKSKGGDDEAGGSSDEEEDEDDAQDVLDAEELLRDRRTRGTGEGNDGT